MIFRASTRLDGARFFDFEGFEAFPMVFSGGKRTRKVAVLDQKGVRNTGAIAGKRFGKGSGELSAVATVRATNTSAPTDSADLASGIEHSQVFDVKASSRLCVAGDATWRSVQGARIGQREGGGGGSRSGAGARLSDRLQRTRIPVKGFHRSDGLLERRAQDKGAFLWLVRLFSFKKTRGGLNHERHT